MSASENGHVAVVQALIASGADVHADNDQALQAASSNGHVAVVQTLLATGADVHANNDYALRFASGDNHIAVVEILLAAGADVHALDNEALRLASEYGHDAVVNILMAASAAAATEAWVNVACTPTYLLHRLYATSAAADLQCCVCLEQTTLTTYTSPIECGHTYCTECILRMNKCAVCRLPFTYKS